MFRVAAFSMLIAFGMGPARADELSGSPENHLPAGLQTAMIRPSLGMAGAGDGFAGVRRPLLNARLAMSPKLIARIDVSEQTMKVQVEGRLLHTWKVSTAGRGYRTPRGDWQPYRMHTMWHSRKYDNAPMPHSIFFTGGYAIHATPHLKRLGTPASHGCVRLHPDNARELFGLTLQYGRAGMRVVVVD